ncbi:Glycosyltransferase involved in cell wall bisynthesis [Halogeometricum rufum]|uniref:Glycosyltransferase involved in cell wall bisynthesis n=1 Tax=Halogeometricum rufum TaxID=553469 RepID=A0A1I6J6M8_9EURY|nr:glycosyltransferase family 4 protein [Halogeometricum rufum]SFR74653.1 Glycosyltransferase involved in cell wall bisynthesis [Halogeometricum rufum]
MRICMLLNAVYPTDIRLAKEVESLAAAGHTVYILSEAGEGLPDREEVGSATVVRRPFQEAYEGLDGVVAGARTLATGVVDSWMRALDELVPAEGIEAIHAHDLPMVHTAIAAGDRHDLPVVADLHENWPEAIKQYRRGDSLAAFTNLRYTARRFTRPLFRWKRIERDAVRRADRVIAVTEEAADHYVDDCGADRSKVDIVPNYVSLDTFDGAELRDVGFEDDFVISYVGTLGGPHRGLDAVVRAMPAVVERVPNAHLVVVGNGEEYRRRLESIVAALGVEEHVTFTGRVPFEEVPSYIHASDVCLVPHQSTGHTETTVPHKLFQYMAMSRPVVVTDVEPLRRFVQDADAGLVVRAGDPAGFALSFVELATDDERRRRLGENGRRAVEDRFSWADAGDALCECYRKLGGDEKSSRRDTELSTV